MARTLLVLGVIVLGVVYFARDRQDRTAVKRVDDQVSLTVTQARRVAVFPLLAPRGLPTTWAPTSVSFGPSGAVGGHQLLHLGYVTPSGRYADLEESDSDVTAALAPQAGKSPRSLGSVPVGARQAEVSVSSGGVLTLSEVVGTVRVGVTGGAGQPELEQLLDSLS